MWHPLVHTLFLVCSPYCLFLTQKCAISATVMLLSNSFQRVDECIKHLWFSMWFRSPMACSLFAVVRAVGSVCVSVKQSQGGESSVCCRSHDPQASRVYCQRVCPRLFKRALQLHDQALLQACLHWHLQRSGLVCLSCRQFNVFSDLIWNPLNWDSAHLRCFTVQKSNGLNSALWRRTVLCQCRVQLSYILLDCKVHGK